MHKSHKMSDRMSCHDASSILLDDLAELLDAALRLFTEELTPTFQVRHDVLPRPKIFPTWNLTESASMSYLIIAACPMNVQDSNGM